MEAAISSYSQARLSFSEKDLQDLVESGQISGEIERYATGSSEYFESHKLPLDVYMVNNDEELRAGGVPIDKSWEDYEKYEITLMPRHIEMMRQKKMIYWDMLARNVRMRSIWISLEGVY